MTKYRYSRDLFSYLSSRQCCIADRCFHGCFATAWRRDSPTILWRGRETFHPGLKTRTVTSSNLADLSFSRFAQDRVFTDLRNDRKSKRNSIGESFSTNRAYRSLEVLSCLNHTSRCVLKIPNRSTPFTGRLSTRAAFDAKYCSVLHDYRVSHMFCERYDEGCA